MIHNLDDTLKELLVQKVPLDPNAIDIKFEVPNKDDWNPKPNKPTINCFLYDIRENHELRSNERYLSRNGTTGTGTEKIAPTRIDLSYLTHIPHPKLSQREITERKNQSEHKNKHKERKKAFEKQ